MDAAFEFTDTDTHILSLISSVTNGYFYGACTAERRDYNGNENRLRRENEMLRVKKSVRPY